MIEREFLSIYSPIVHILTVNWEIVQMYTRAAYNKNKRNWCEKKIQMVAIENWK